MSDIGAAPKAVTADNAARYLLDVCRRGIPPLCGGILLGATAMPAIAGQAAPAESPAHPRLRLTTILASLQRDGESGVTESADPPRDTEQTNQEPAPLTLAWNFQLPLNAPALPPLPALPSSPASETPRPEERLSGREPAALPRRRIAAEKNDLTSRSADTARNLKVAAAGTPPLPPASEQNTPAPRPGTADAKVVGSDDFLPADELDTDLLPSQPRAAGTEPPPASAAARNLGWGLAPIRWGGTLSAGLRNYRSDNSTGSTSQVYEARLRANSYIWKPYIALVSGDFALTTVRSQDSGGAASSNLMGTSVTGSGSLNVFPQSRFPFSASLSLADSRSDGSFSDSNVQQRRLALRQNYRPQIGQWTAAGGYDRSEITGNFGSDTVDRVYGNFSNTLDRQAFNISGDFSKSQAIGQTTKSFFVGGGHSFTYSDELQFNTSASFTGQQFDLATGGAALSAKTQSAQIFSYANWAPSESKWRGSANVRYFQTNNTFDGATFDNRTFGAAASLSYQASRNLSLFGSAGMNFDTNNQMSSNESLGISYSGDALRFGNFDYVWFSSLSASNSTTGDGDSARTISGSLGHTLTRSWQLPEKTSLYTSLNQSLTKSRATGVGSSDTTSLTHGASVSLQANAGEALSGYLSASLSDSRTTGETTSSFQMLNVQLTGFWRINAYSELNSNLTWQMSRQASDRNEVVVVSDEFGRPVLVDTSTRSGSTGLGGGLGYGHRRVMGVRGLRYRLDFRANTNRDDSRRFGNADALREQDRATLELDQRLLYRIGRLDTELQYRVAEIEGRRNQLLFFRVSREFGSF